ncbi:MAG: glycosyltransferase [Gaiellaceae bacterium]
MSDISVVVPTRDRVPMLERCLDGLRRQRGVGGIEVIVVDDGSSDARGVERLAAAAAELRLVRLDGHGRGPAAARNAGARAAGGEILLFTDDDCVPDSEWAARLSRRLAEADVVAGLTLPGRPGDALLVASQIVSSYAALRIPLLLGNNLGCRRSLLLAQPFDESFATPAGEDREWSARLRRGGMRLVREPGAIVWHYSELDLSSFWRQHVRYGRAAAPRPGRPGAPLQHWRFYAGLVRAGFAEGPRVGLLVLLSQLATARGRAARPWRARG